MEGKCEEVNELETASSDSFIDDMDNDEPSSSGQDDGVNLETPLTEEEIEELISELLEVESKAAEAQESLEDEALAKIEIDVREELAQSYNGDELEKAVMDEMETLKEEWEAVLDELETECAHLLEQLDGAGIELPSLYKWIESQAPNGCSTEAWKKRTHWVGSQVTNDVTVVLADTEKYLQTHRPVRNKLGKVLEEGASGFLGKKLAIDGKEALIETSDLDWSSLNGIFSSSADSTSFGSNHWAYVYLASTPQQAAQLGIKFPGVDEVEEIDDLEGSSDFPDAIVNEEESNLSEEQKKNFRKVKEEDDVDIDRKLQLLLKRRRQRNRCKQEALQKDVSSVDRLVEGNIDDSETLNSVLVENPVGPNDYKIDITRDSSQIGSDSSLPSLIDARGFKRLHDSDEVGSDYKKTRVVTIDSDVETVVTKDESCLTLDGACDRVDHQDLQGIKNGRFPACNLSQSVEDNFHCTSCHKVATEVHPYPLLDVIICGECKSLIESKTHVKDPECSECYCGWCGRNSDLISCRSCKKLFCTICIRSNLGGKCLFEVQASRWKCCYCSPSILHMEVNELCTRDRGPNWSRETCNFFLWISSAVKLLKHMQRHFPLSKY